MASGEREPVLDDIKWGFGRVVGNDHFCDTTKRASQRLTPHIQGEIPLYHRSGNKPLDSTTLGFGDYVQNTSARKGVAQLAELCRKLSGPESHAKGDFVFLRNMRLVLHSPFTLAFSLRSCNLARLLEALKSSGSQNSSRVPLKHHAPHKETHWQLEQSWK